MNKVAATTIRLREANRASLQRHFTSLDNEDRRLRFGARLGDEVIAGYVDRLDFERDGLFAVQDETLELVAVVHVALSGTSAELGLSVIPRGRGKGLGNALFRRAVTFLRNRGAIEVFVHCLNENGAMMHLARKNGMRIVYSGGESDACLALEPATAQTLANEWFDDQKASLVQAMRLNLRMAQAFMGIRSPATRVP